MLHRRFIWLVVMVVMAFAVASVTATQANAQEPISIESLFHEMVDRDAVARFPQHDFRQR